jgi:dienelactone hydrolase
MVILPMPRDGEQLVAIPLDGAWSGELEASLSVPEEAKGIALLVHGALSSRCCPRDEAVASALRRGGFATVLVDLLTEPETEEEMESGRYSLDLDLLAGRVVAATRWIAASPETRALPLGHFGAGTGAAAVLAAAAAAPDCVEAIVSCGGRVDLLHPALLSLVASPVLLVEGTAETGPRAQEKDERVLAMVRSAQESLPCARVAILRGATHWLGEPGTADRVARLAADWFEAHLAVRDPWAMTRTTLAPDDAPTGPPGSRVRFPSLGL